MPRPLALIALVAIALTTVLAAGPAMAQDGDSSLFVNLTSDELNRASMAISFATRVLEEKEIPVTIFLNVEGVRLADPRIPAQTYATGKTPRQMLEAFMEAGGMVIACPMCMKNVGGLTEDVLIDGVVVGSSDVTWPPMFAEGATVLSY